MPVLTPSLQRRALRMGLVLWSAWMAAGGPPSRAEAEVSKEYQIKAVFLFNFTQFVKWPPSAFTGAGEPFCIGILGDDPFDGFLDETVAGEKVEGRPMAVRRYRRIQDVKDCQVLFISRSESGRMESILAALKGSGILTVGESRGFAENGGIIRFVKEDNRIHFRINLEAAKRAGLAISSQVLRLAEIVGPGKE